LLDKSFQPILFTYSIQLSSEYVLKQEFKLKYAYKNALILSKNRKNCPELKAPPQTPALALHHYIPNSSPNYKPAVSLDIKGMMEQNK